MTISLSLLHRTSNALLSLFSISLLLVSLGAHSDNMLTSDDYLLDESETNQRMLNAMWLEQGMEEKPDYALNRDALHLLTKGLLKKSWAALVHKNQSYERYTPVVSGHFAPGDSHTSYDVRVNWSNVKLTFNYSF